MNFLSREATVAKSGFSRWLVPPAAIAVHMCIGEVYGFSVVNVPLTQAGADERSLRAELFDEPPEMEVETTGDHPGTPHSRRTRRRVQARGTPWHCATSKTSDPPCGGTLPRSETAG